jgi:plastocyanin
MSRSLSLSLGFGLSLALAAGCTGSFTGGPGGGGGGDDDGITPGAPDASPVPVPDAGPPPSYTMAIDPPAAELVLGETTTFTITITPEHGFTGPVTLAATGAMASWQATFDSPSVNVTDANPVTATLTLAIPTDGEAGDAMLAVSGDASAGQKTTAPSAVTVKPELVIHIPANALNNPDNAFGAGGQIKTRFIAPGTKVTWVNDDAVAHRIHGDGVNGLDHEPNNMGPGSSYSVTLQAPGIYNYYCHIHPQMVGTLVVQ